MLSRGISCDYRSGTLCFRIGSLFCYSACRQYCGRVGSRVAAVGFIIVGLVILREHVYYMRMQTVGIVHA